VIETVMDARGGVDVHAHWFGADLGERVARSDPRWPVLRLDSESRGSLLLGDSVFRQVGRSLWDVPTRLTDLDAAGIGHQVISPVPVMLAYWAERGAATRFATATNDSIASAVGASAGRLRALGCVPLPHVDDAIAELHRVIEVLGLAGVEIGTRIGEWELDDPHLLPFFAAADDLGAVLFVHPMDGGGGVVRRAGQPFDFGIGMGTDTALAAGALVFGGVLARLPSLKVVLAHGCGTFAWSYPRMRLGARIWNDAAVEDLDEIVRRLWVDSLVLDPGLLGVLVRRFGGGRVMLGTDHPFVPGLLQDAGETLVRAGRDGFIEVSEVERIFGENARKLFGIGEADGL
jgi:aminocarboxymuconate-semialdehyde decarboxylase